VLRALGRQDPPLTDTEVLLALDAAADQAPDVSVAGHDVAPRTLRASVAGASGARNAGWRAASAPLVLFLDDDIVPSRQLIAHHLSWHLAHPEPEVAVLGLVRWSSAVRVTPFMRWLEMGIQFDYGTIRSVDVEWQRFYTCNISVKRELLERVGGFDEERFPYGYEDLELGRRLSDQGLRLMYNSRAVGEHLKTETLNGWRRNLRRIACAERRLTAMYPSEPAYFYELFRTAAEAPPSRGRWARLAPLVHPGVPWLGDRVWRSYDIVCRQRLAGEFLREWDAASAAAVAR
jgi:cellulose synthase/poly-beta-1,6-N-acetylglucosamine synthase-like glycosyltransferase